MIKKVLLSLLCAAALTGSAFGAAYAAGGETNSAVSPADLWTADDGVSVTANVAAPDYMTNGWYKEYLASEAKLLTPEDLPDYRKNGVQITSSAGNAKVTFKNAIDVSSLTKDDELLSVAPLTASRGTTSFTDFDIVLTDADDPDNYVSISILQNRWWTVGSLIRAGTAEIPEMGYKWGNYGQEVTTNGCETLYSNFLGTVASTVDGVADEDMLYVPFSIRYDAAEKTVYFLDYQNKVTPVIDLDDGASVGFGSEWGGFTADRVILSVAAAGFMGAQADFMIFNVAGTHMNGVAVNDTQKPSVLVEKAWDTPPDAAVGKPYALYPAVAYDAVSGDLAVKISVKEAAGAEFVEISGDSYVFETAGDYVLRYEATDAAGLTETVDFSVKARYGIEPLRVDVETPQGEYKVGESIPVPEAVVSGGSGRAETEVYVERALTGERIETENGAFTVRLPGEYYLRYRARDYLGNETVKSVLYNVGSDGLPVIEGEIEMYARFVDGETYKLPVPSAYDYVSRPGAKLNAAVKITAAGTGDKAAYREEVEDYVFTPAKEKFGDEVTITYEISCGEGTPDVQTYTVPVIEPKTLADYFDYDAAEVIVGYNKNTDEERMESYMTFTRRDTSDAESFAFAFIHPLKANGFSTRFSFPFEVQNFARFNITLRDADNASIGFTMTVEKYTASQTYVYYNGQKYSMAGGFDTADGVSATPLTLQYVDGTIVDYTDAKVFVPSVNADGTAFTGFPSGQVFVEFEVEGITGAAGVKMSNVGSQQLYADYDSDGNVRPYTDVVAPELEYEEDMPERFTLNQRVRLPYVTAYDNMSPHIGVTVTLTAPDGTQIYSDAPSVRGMSFVIESYGIYRLSFYAEDRAGRMKLDSFTISAEDLIAPTVTLASYETLTGKVGKSVKLPEVTVLDNYDAAPKLSVFAVDQAGTYSLIEGGKFTPETKGRYTIRFYAYDANYNVAITDIVCNVE